MQLVVSNMLLTSSVSEGRQEYKHMHMLFLLEGSARIWDHPRGQPAECPLAGEPC